MKVSKTNNKLSMMQQSIMDKMAGLRVELLSQEEDGETVHEIRVCIKHLRGWLRLLRIRNREFDWKKTDKQLHNIAKGLGAARDQRVLIDTLESLMDIAKTKEQRSSIKQLRKKLNKIEDLQQNKVELEPEFLRLVDIINQQAVEIPSVEVLKKGLFKTYNKARRHGQQAYAGANDYSSLHQFRKWVKYLNYQLLHLRAAYPQIYGKEKTVLKKLGESLGDLHDLVMLQQELQTNKTFTDVQDEIKLISALIKKQSEKIIAESKTGYDSLFSISADDFIKKFYV